MRQRNVGLAQAATDLLVQRLGTEAGAAAPMTAAMGLARLPLPAEDAAATRLRDWLLEAGTDAPVHRLDGAVWLRLSAFAYNDLNDYARLADLLDRAPWEEMA